MATFSKAVFNAASYASFRPTYPKVLFDVIYSYHANSPSATWGRVVDLGCGTGQATQVLAERFISATGVDPSAGMVSTASKNNENPKINFVQSPAEKLEFLEDDSVDLVTAAQAAHWFRYDALWPQLARVLKPGGSVAFWNYSEFRLVNYPKLTPLINAYASDPSQNLGAFFERPGRTILEMHLQAIKTPSEHPWEAKAEKRVYFVGDQYQTSRESIPIARGFEDTEPTNNPIRLGPSDEHQEVIIKTKLTWENLDGYLRTWSPLVGFKEANPEDASRPDGDIVQRFVSSLKDGIQREAGNIPSAVEIEFPLALILLRKSS